MTMRKILRWAALPALVALAVLPAAADKVMYGVDGPLTDGAIRAIVEAAPSEKERPDQDALILFEGTWIDRRDGKTEVRVQRLTKLYTEWAIEHLGDPRIAWAEGRQELIIHASRTYLPGGRPVDTPTIEEHGYSGTNEVTPDALALAVDHLDIREMVVTRVGLVRESVILLDYTIRDRSPSPLPFHMLHFPQGEFPIREATVSAGAGLAAETVNPADRLIDLPEAELRDGRAVWHMKDLPPRPRDSGHRIGDQIPWIALSSAKDWQEAVERFDKAVRGAAAPDEALRAALLNLEKEPPRLGARETIESWTKLAADRTETVRYHCWRFLADPRPLNRVLERAYATPAERAALLLACCRTRDWKTELILPARWAALSTAAPAMEALGDPLLRVTDEDGGIWWVDPMEGSVSTLPPVKGGAVFFVSDGETIRRETAPSQEDRIDVRVFWDLAEGKGKAEVEMSGPLTAALDPWKPEDLVKRWIGEWCEGASLGELRVYDSGEDRIRFSAAVEAPLPEPGDRGRIEMTPPFFPADLSRLVPRGMERAHGSSDAVLFPANGGEARALWIFKIPGGKSILDEAPAEARWNFSEMKISRKQAEDRFNMTVLLRWSGDPVRPEDYGAYRGFLARVLDRRAGRIALAGVGEE